MAEMTQMDVFLKNLHGLADFAAKSSLLKPEDIVLIRSAAVLIKNFNKRLEGEISEAKVIAAAKAACEATKGGLCHFPNCICEDAARKAIVAALEAAAREA